MNIIDKNFNAWQQTSFNQNNQFGFSIEGKKV